MSIESDLLTRAASKCELCEATDGLVAFEIPPDFDGSVEQSVLVCSTCRGQIDDADSMAPNHWRCLNDSMWSQVPAVQVVVWRMLQRLKGEGWPLELLEQMYLAEDVRQWAEAGMALEDDKETPTLDSNGASLQDGDTVTLIKDLVVKGAGFTAKRGTTVKGISLTSNPLHIEGRVSGQAIVLVAAFLKKA